MAQEWNVRCGDCGVLFGYSQATYAARSARGLELPRLCLKCSQEYMRERRTLARTAGDLAGMAELSRAAAPLGRLRDLPPADPIAVAYPSIVNEARGEFGLQDEQLEDFYRQLDSPRTQVIIVVAPTGAGKSTFFPYRLLVPPAGWDPEFLTRAGQIVVTQPRIQATRNIPSYVAKLHGCRVGAGYDIGFRHAAEHACNWLNKLVYVTDGTLINWIASGQLGNIGLIMIDEAHERSLNIDLIIGLLTKVLPRYPRLKLVIASATIDEEKFKRFFGAYLRGGAECGYVRFDGKPGKPVRKHFRCGRVQWENPLGVVQRERDDAPAEILPYNPGDLKPLLADLPRHVAEKCVELLERMYPADGSMEDPLVRKRGDILAFLQGKKPIEDAAGLIKKAIASNERLKRLVDVLPLYTELPQAQQDKALCDPTRVMRKLDGKDVPCRSMCFRLKEQAAPGENLLDTSPDGVVARRRVIISTNVAETSLTIHGILHVVETGIINQNTWDSATETTGVQQFIHSRAGCRQRWGRAGRVSAGDAWCLYSYDQFEQFPQDTPPSIGRSRLEPVVLAAKMAGLETLDPKQFPWIDPPAEQELARAVHRLRQHRALDENGDITPHGVEIFRFSSGDPLLANLMIMADRFGCAVEMATVLPILEMGGKLRLLVKATSEGADTLRAIHGALAGACLDDLELYLKVYAAWTEARLGGPAITGTWAWKEIWGAACKSRPAPEAVRTALGAEKFAELEKALAEVSVPGDFQERVAPLGPVGLKAFADWINSLASVFGPAASETWARLWGVNDAALRHVEKRRDETIDSLAVRKKDKERRPIHFELLNRLRLLFLWCSPDQCFLRTAEFFKEQPLYEVVREDLSVLPKRVVESDVEDDEGEEPPPELPAYRVEISDRSHCQGRTPDAFIGFGRKTRRANKPHPNAKAIDLVNIGFVVWIDRAWLRRVCGASIPQLGMLMAELLPHPVSLVEEGPTRYRLFLDQRYPVFSQWKCHPMRQLDANSWLVEMSDPRLFWPESSAIETPQKTEEEEEEAPAGPRDLSTNIHVDLIEQPRVDDASMARADDVDDSDEDEDQTLNPSLSGNQQPKPQPVRAVLHVDENEQLPDHDVVAEVTGYAQRDQPGALVHLQWPTPQIRFENFCARFRVGDVVAVAVKEHRSVTHSPVVSLLVEEPQTGFLTEVLPEDLAFHYSSRLAEFVPSEASFQLAVTEILPRRGKVKLSALPLLEERLAKLVAEGMNRLTPAQVFDTGERHVRFLIGRPEEMVPGSLLTAELFQRDGKVPMRCRPRAAATIRIDLRRDADVRMNEVPENLREIVNQVAPLFGGRLYWSAGEGKLRYTIQLWNPQTRTLEIRRISGAELSEACALVTEPQVRTALQRLYRNSNQLMAFAADPLLEERYPAGMRVRGRLSKVGEAGSDRNRGSDGRLTLESGFEAMVPSSEFVDGEGRATGSFHPATVMETSASEQRMRVTLRQNENEICMAQLRGMAVQLGLLTRDYRTNLGKLPRRDQLPKDLRELHGRNPWIAWARLDLPMGLKNGNPWPSAGIILGAWPDQPARHDIERSHNVILSADRTDAYILAAHQKHITAAVLGIQQRIRGASVVDGEEPETEPPFGDRFQSRRLAPCAQIAAPTKLESGAPLERLAEGLNALRGLLKMGR